MWLNEYGRIEICKEKQNNKYKEKEPQTESVLKENYTLNEENEHLKKTNKLLLESLKQKENYFQLVRERSSGPNIIETRKYFYRN